MATQSTLDTMLPAHAKRALELEAAESPSPPPAKRQGTLEEFAEIATSDGESPVPTVSPVEQVTFAITTLTPEKCNEWRDEPGLGVTFLDNHVGSDLMEMSVNGLTVACVVIRIQGGGTRILDILVRQSARGRGYGKQVMLHTYRELFSSDAVKMIQLNVICRGK
jgi:hypothetical protein